MPSVLLIEVAVSLFVGVLHDCMYLVVGKDGKRSVVWTVGLKERAEKKNSLDGGRARKRMDKDKKV